MRRLVLAIAAIGFAGSALAAPVTLPISSVYCFQDIRIDRNGMDGEDVACQLVKVEKTGTRKWNATQVCDGDELSFTVQQTGSVLKFSMGGKSWVLPLCRE